MTGMVPDFSSAQAIGSERIIPGFLLALVLHIGLAVLFVPVMKYSPPAAPVRIAVQVSQLQEKVEPVMEAPEVVEVEPIPEPVELIKPPITDKQILVAKDDTTPEPEELVVLEPVPEETVVEEVKPIEPPPEPVKTEPKKVEKPQPKVEPKLEKPKVIEKPKQKLPIAEPELAEVIEPVTPIPEEPATEISSLPSSTVNPDHASSTSNVVDASGDNPNETNRGGTDEVDRNEAWKGYGQLLYAMVSKNKTYPQQAIRRHLEGIVLVSVRFDKGKMVEINVLGQGSGHTVLDKAAQDMLEKAVKAMPVRGHLSNKSFTVVVPVDFKLTG